MIACSHGSTSTTTIERAIKVLSERFEYLKINMGHAHRETITVLRELVLMYKKLKTQEAHSIVKRLLLNATIEILTRENDSKQLYEVAKSMGEIYISFDLQEYGHEILRELRRQIITGTTTPGNKLGLKLGKSTGRISYVFLVAFEETIRGSMITSYSKAMADLLLETTLYESFTRCLKSENKIELIIAHGARLRAFWHARKQFDQVAILQDQLYEIFLKKWGSVIKTRRESSFIFFVSLLEEIKEVRADIQMGDVACQSGNNKVRVLLTEGNYQQAYEVALSAFQFVNYQQRYHELHNVGHGFKLSALMAGRGLEHRSEKAIEPQLRKQMLELSRTVIREVLQACKDSKIDFARLQLRELNDLVGLLGEQQNYADLEVSRATPSTSSDVTFQKSQHCISCPYIDTFYSGFSMLSGSLAKYRRRGRPKSSPPSVDVSQKPASSGVIARMLSVFVKACATTSAVSGDLSNP